MFENIKPCMKCGSEARIIVKSYINTVKITITCGNCDCENSKVNVCDKQERYFLTGAIKDLNIKYLIKRWNKNNTEKHWWEDYDFENNKPLCYVSDSPIYDVNHVRVSIRRVKMLISLDLFLDTFENHWEYAKLLTVEDLVSK